MEDKELIFLISQPRSGSTLLQKILDRSQQLCTVPEPWLMLNFSYSIKGNGLFAEYDRRSGYEAVSCFIDNLPYGGRSQYLASLKNFCLELYGAYAQQVGARYFLDKTPRYYFIINQLREIFPDSRFLILRRNPLSVLYSIVRTWSKDSWFRLSDFKHDLLEGFLEPERYRADSNILYVHYEQLVINPDKELQRICDYLGVPYSDEMLAYEYGLNWGLGDKGELLKSGKVSASSLHSWKTDQLSYQEWRVLFDYLHWIGKLRLDEAGYDFNELEQALMSNCPANGKESVIDTTFSLDALLENTSMSLYQYQQVLEKNKELNRLVEEMKNGSIVNWASLRRKLSKLVGLE